MLRIHPRSRDFTWASNSSGAENPLIVSKEQSTKFDQDGYFVIDQLLDPEQVAAITLETDQGYEEAHAFLRDLPDERLFIAEKGAISFAPHLARSSQILLEHVLTSAIAGLAHDLLGTDARLYHDQAVYKETEKPRRFPWHQDNGYAFVSPESYLTVWIALTDATIESGCPWVAPGMHRTGTMIHDYVDPLGWEVFESPPVEPVAAPVPAGGAVVFSSLTPHLTGPNVSSRTRKAYIVQYVGSAAVRYENSSDQIGTALNDDFLYPMIRVNK